MLNYVETTPESDPALRGDVHEHSPEAASAMPKPVPGVSGENAGWTSTGGNGPMTNVELLETGPLRGRVRLTRDGESWELTWTAGAAWLRWKAVRGFRLTSISALPYLPFDRCLGGSSMPGRTDRATWSPPITTSRREAGKSCRAATLFITPPTRTMARWAWWRSTPP